MQAQEFELWLEFEIGDPTQPGNRPTQNFANIRIKVADGRRYALNVWTFDFLPHARYPWPYETQPAGTSSRYVVGPDLFVERLDRATIESVVAEMIARGELKPEWLLREDDDT
jgi:hypothetical protein